MSSSLTDTDADYLEGNISQDADFGWDGIWDLFPDLEGGGGLKESPSQSDVGLSSQLLAHVESSEPVLGTDGFEISFQVDTSDQVDASTLWNRGHIDLHNSQPFVAASGTTFQAHSGVQDESTSQQNKLCWSDFPTDLEAHSASLSASQADLEVGGVQEGSTKSCPLDSTTSEADLEVKPPEMMDKVSGQDGIAGTEHSRHQRSENWRKKEDRKFFLLRREAHRTGYRGKALWTFMSTELERRHGILRSAKCCQNHGDSWRKYYRAMQRYGPENFWENNLPSHESRALGLPKYCKREWFNTMKVIQDPTSSKEAREIANSKPSGGNGGKVQPVPQNTMPHVGTILHGVMKDVESQIQPSPETEASILQKRIAVVEAAVAAMNPSPETFARQREELQESKKRNLEYEKEIARLRKRRRSRRLYKQKP